MRSRGSVDGTTATSESFGQDLAATDGESFELSGYFARATVPPFADGHFEVWVADAGGTIAVVGTIGEDVDSAWEFDSLSFAVPFDIVRWGLRGASTASGFLSYAVCDDLVLTRDGPVPTHETSWGGLKHNSR